MVRLGTPLKERVTNLSRRERVMLLLVFIIAVFVLFWQFLLLPVEAEQAQVTEEKQMTQQQVNQLLRQLEEWETYEEELPDPASELAEMEQALPGHEELEPTFHSIAVILHEQDIVFDTIAFSREPVGTEAEAEEAEDAEDDGAEEAENVEGEGVDDVEGVHKVTMAGNFQGTFLDIRESLNRLEDKERLVNVTALEIAALEEEGIFTVDEEAQTASQLVDAYVEMEFYWDHVATREPERLDPEGLDMGKLDLFIEVEDIEDADDE